MFVMENIIEEILQIEEQANQYLAQAEDKRKDNSLQMRKKIDEFKRTLDKMTRERIRMMTEEFEKQTRALLSELESEGETRMQRMEEDFAKNRNIWENQLVQQILYND